MTEKRGDALDYYFKTNLMDPVGIIEFEEEFGDELANKRIRQLRGEEGARLRRGERQRKLAVARERKKSNNNKIKKTR